MKKRIVSVMLCAAMGVSLFTGACVVEAKADGKDKIVVWMKKTLQTLQITCSKNAANSLQKKMMWT